MSTWRRKPPEQVQASDQTGSIPSTVPVSSLMRKCRACLLNQGIDAALAARRIRAQAVEAAERGTAFQARSRLMFNGAVWLSTATIIGVLTACVLM